MAKPMNTLIVIGILAVFLNGCSSAPKEVLPMPRPSDAIPNDTIYLPPDGQPKLPDVPYPGVTVTGEARESKAGLVVSGTLIDDEIDAQETYIGKMVQIKGTYHQNMCGEARDESLPVQCFDGPYLTDIVSIKIVNDTPPEKVEADYAAWQLAKKELDKFQIMIGLNINDYMDPYAEAIELEAFYKYDDALAAVDYMPTVYPKMIAALADFQPQKDFPEIAQIKTLYTDMIALEKTSSEYLRKYIVASKAGNSAAKKANETLYVKYYKDAMAKGREMMDVYVKVLAHGADIEEKKLLKDNLPPLTPTK